MTRLLSACLHPRGGSLGLVHWAQAAAPSSRRMDTNGC